MNIRQNISLKNLNTFGIEVRARFFVEIFSIEDLKKALQFSKDNNLPFLILGGGSNLLFTKDFDGLILKMSISGKEIVRKGDKKVLIKANAGENWHEFVQWTLEQGFSGIENLALIPGQVGSAPIQNIGAYGVEVKDVIECVEVLDVETLKVHKIVNEACIFGYRDSVFKRNKGKYIITAVGFKLKISTATPNTSYGAIQSVLLEKGIHYPDAKDVANAVMEIRQSKLPDPTVLGNAGSFFKNPVIAKEWFPNIQKKYPDIPFYSLQNQDTVKIPAGWLIEQCGFKGKRFGNVGVHEQQALVLVNYGNATGKQVLELAQTIQKTVQEQFSIALEMEVNVL